MADNIYGGILQRPEVGFDAVRDGRRAPVFWYDVDLSTARSVAAGTQVIIPIAGDSFYADLDPVNQGDAVVTFQDTTLTSHGAPVYVTRGHIANTPFTKLMIENEAQPGKRLRFFYGVGLDFRPGASSSVSVSGVVTVIDSEVNRTLSGQGFSFVGNGAAVVGQFAYFQIWNPPASGKIIRIDQCAFATTTSSGINAGIYNTALTTFLSNGFNKLSGGAPSTGESRSQNSAVDFVAGNTQFFMEQLASDGKPIKFTYPIVLNPGSGFTCRPAPTNVGITGWVECLEYAI